MHAEFVVLLVALCRSSEIDHTHRIIQCYSGLSTPVTHVMHLHSNHDYQIETIRKRCRSSAAADDPPEPKRLRLEAENHAKALAEETGRLLQKLHENFSGILLQATSNHGRMALCRARFCLIYNESRNRTIDPRRSPFRFLLTNPCYCSLSCLATLADYLNRYTRVLPYFLPGTHP